MQQRTFKKKKQGRLWMTFHPTHKSWMSIMQHANYSNIVASRLKAHYTCVSPFWKVMNANNPFLAPAASPLICSTCQRTLFYRYYVCISRSCGLLKLRWIMCWGKRKFSEDWLLLLFRPFSAVAMHSTWDCYSSSTITSISRQNYAESPQSRENSYSSLYDTYME